MRKHSCGQFLLAWSKGGWNGGEEGVGTIGVRGVFLQRGGISQASMLLACFNSAGGANAGL